MVSVNRLLKNITMPVPNMTMIAPRVKEELSFWPALNFPTGMRPERRSRLRSHSQSVGRKRLSRPASTRKARDSSARSSGIGTSQPGDLVRETDDLAVADEPAQVGEEQEGARDQQHAHDDAEGPVHPALDRA